MSALVWIVLSLIELFALLCLPNVPRYSVPMDLLKCINLPSTTRSTTLAMTPVGPVTIQDREQ